MIVERVYDRKYRNRPAGWMYLAMFKTRWGSFSGYAKSPQAAIAEARFEFRSWIKACMLGDWRDGGSGSPTHTES